MANISADYTAMQTASSQLTNGEATISQDLDRLQGVISNLVNSSFVTDHASKAFDNSYQEFTTGAKHMIEGLKGMSQWLDKAIAAMQETDHTLSTRI